MREQQKRFISVQAGKHQRTRYRVQVSVATSRRPLLPLEVLLLLVREHRFLSRSLAIGLHLAREGVGSLRGSVSSLLIVGVRARSASTAKEIRVSRMGWWAGV